MKYFYSILFVISLLFITVVAMTHVNAQIAEPFLEGPNITVENINIRCMNHATLKSMLDTREFKLSIIATKNNVIKFVAYNKDSDVVVGNIIEDQNKACIFDILEHAGFSEEWHFPTTTSKVKPEEQFQQ